MTVLLSLTLLVEKVSSLSNGKTGAQNDHNVDTENTKYIIDKIKAPSEYSKAPLTHITKKRKIGMIYSSVKFIQ